MSDIVSAAKFTQVAQWLRTVDDPEVPRKGRFSYILAIPVQVSENQLAN